MDAVERAAGGGGALPLATRLAGRLLLTRLHCGGLTTTRDELLVNLGEDAEEEEGEDEEGKEDDEEGGDETVDAGLATACAFTAGEGEAELTEEDEAEGCRATARGCSVGEDVSGLAEGEAAAEDGLSTVCTLKLGEVKADVEEEAEEEPIGAGLATASGFKMGEDVGGIAAEGLAVVDGLSTACGFAVGEGVDGLAVADDWDGAAVGASACGDCTGVEEKSDGAFWSGDFDLLDRTGG